MPIIYMLLIGCGRTGPLYIPEQRYPLPPQKEVQKAPTVATDNQPTEELKKD
ncbi:MAG: lipoprotein [Methylophilaceae bacterium]